MNSKVYPKDRLFPQRYSSRYYSLTQLRKSLESLASIYIDPSVNDLVLLDYGCGTKPYFPIFNRYVSNYIGVDFPGNDLADFQLPLNGKINLADASVDIVLSTQVLEHTLSPGDYLDECFRVLRPNGLLLLSTHGYWKYHPDPVDFWRWTSEGLKIIVQEGGFDITHFEGIMGLAATSIQLLQDGLIVKVPKPFEILFSFTSQLLISFFDSFYSTKSRDKDACIYLLVAHKKDIHRQT